MNLRTIATIATVVTATAALGVMYINNRRNTETAEVNAEQQPTSEAPVAEEETTTTVTTDETVEETMVRVTGNAYPPAEEERRPFDTSIDQEEQTVESADSEECVTFVESLNGGRVWSGPFLVEQAMGILRSEGFSTDTPRVMDETLEDLTVGFVICDVDYTAASGATTKQGWYAAEQNGVWGIVSVSTYADGKVFRQTYEMSDEDQVEISEAVALLADK